MDTVTLNRRVGLAAPNSLTQAEQAKRRAMLEAADAQVCATIQRVLREAYPNMRRDLAAIITHATAHRDIYNPRVRYSISYIATHQLSEGVTTLNSRWMRAAQVHGLPTGEYTPKALLDRILLIRIARLLEHPGVSLSSVATQLALGSIPQLSVFVRRLTGARPSIWRIEARAETELAAFVTHLAPLHAWLTTPADPARSFPTPTPPHA